MTRARVLRNSGWVLLAAVSVATCKTSSGDDDEEPVRLLLGVIGTGSGTITGPGPLTCPVICNALFDVGAIVNLTATPAAGSIFAGWEKDCAGGFAIVDLEIDDDPECDARFDLDPAVRTLQVTIESAPGSTGKVTGTGIDCGDGATDCSEAYPLNSTVHLSVWAPSTSLFKGWDDDCLTFTSAAEIDLSMDADKSCKAAFDVASSGGLQPKGSISFNYRVEAGALLANKVIVTGFDNGGPGDIIDVSNIDALSSPAGAEFSTCGGARGMTTFFSNRPQYNSDVAFTTCTNSRQASTTPASGGFTEIQFLPFAPGKSAYYQNNWMAISDFEFGRLWLRDQSQSPQLPIQINLTPGERSCPFSLTLNAGFAYVVGREGEAGTPTANCNNWVGVWKVDLTLNSVVGFAKFGTKLRDAAYGADDRLYVTDFEEDRVYVVNPTTMAQQRSLGVGDGPVGLKLNPTATGMWVTNWNSNKLQYWNLTNDMLIDEEDSGGVHPVDVFISGPNGFVLNFGDAGANIGGSLRAFQYSF